MHSSIVVIVLFVAIATTSADPLTWSNCDKNSLFQPTAMAMHPYPAVASQNVTVLTTGVSSAVQRGGTWKTAVKKFGITVETYTGNVCGLVPTCPCPCPPGTYTTQLVLPVPSFALSGRYTGEFTAVTEDGKSIVCVDYAFDIGS